jgi:hypothetical protein
MCKPEIGSVFDIRGKFRNGSRDKRARDWRRWELDNVLPSKEANQQTLPLRIAGHSRTLEAGRRLEPTGSDPVVEADTVNRDGIAPEGFDARKGSEHRQGLLR